MDLVGPGVMNLAHDTMNVVGRPRRELPAENLAVVLHADEDDATVRIRECDGGLLERFPAGSRLSLSMFALAGERLSQLHSSHGQGDLSAVLGVKGGICQSSRSLNRQNRSYA